MQGSSGVTLRRCSSLRGSRSALCPKPWNNSRKKLLGAELCSEKSLRSNQEKHVLRTTEDLDDSDSRSHNVVVSLTFPEKLVDSEISENKHLSVDREDTGRCRRKSSPALAYQSRLVDHSKEKDEHAASDADLNLVSSAEKGVLQSDRYKANRRKRAIHRAPYQRCSSSDSESATSDGCQRAFRSPRRCIPKNSASRSKSSPLISRPVELNSPTLERKLQRASNTRSKSDNNFQKKSRKIKLEGCTYKLTMEPHAVTDDDTNRDESSLDSAHPVVTEAAESSSLPRQKSISDSERSKDGIFTKREMKQAQKWVSEREDQARRINLEKPVRLPSTDEDCFGNNEVSDEISTLLPGVDTREALDCAALRLRRITQELDDSNVTPRALKDSLQYAISVLEMRFLNRTSYSDDDSDADASLQGDSIVPPEIKRWLMQTFSTSGADGKSKRKGERRTLRSVVHVMQAGMFVERMFRKSSAAANFNIVPEIVNHLKDIDKWQYDVFALEDLSTGNALKYTFYEVLSKYDLIRKYKISGKSLFAFCDRLQVGYRKHNNRYHNPIHAADVTQCISVFLNRSGFTNWLTDLEVFAMIFAAAIHDLEHTGTTNNFHTQTRSTLALLYNDKSVLENHHVCAAFRILWEDPECDILSSLSKDDYKQFRELVIEMVLATDMSLHFGQVKNMKSMLQHPEKMERSKAMSLMMHSADISHPTRPWEQHQRWTARLMDEFFEQGDRERELQLPLSPLVDRHSTMVAQSQIGFIDYVLKPTYEILHDLFWRVNGAVTGDQPRNEDDQNGPSSISTASLAPPPDSQTSPRRRSEATSQQKQSSSNAAVKAKISEFRNTIKHYMRTNRQKWEEKDKEEQVMKQSKRVEHESGRSSSEGQSSTTDNVSSDT